MRTIRARLTLTYAGLLIATLVVLGAGLYFAMARALSEEASDSARRLADQAAHLLSQSSEGESRAIDDSDATLAQTLARGELYLEVRNPDGSVASRSSGLEKTSLVPSTFAAQSPPLLYTRVIPTLGPLTIYVSNVRSNGKLRGVVAAASSLYEVEGTLANLRTILIVTSLLSLVVAAASGWWLAGVALRPVDQITRAASSISAGGLSERLSLRGPDDELHRLAATFDGMLDRLEGAFERERRFTGYVAHELKTPLTILQGEIDVALRRPRSGDEYRMRLESLRVEVERLSSLVQELLSFARAETDAEALRKDQVALQPLVEAVVAQFKPTAMRRSVSVRALGRDDVTVIGDADRLRQAVSNLVDNAIRHSEAGGTVTVEWRATATGVVVEVADNGQGIEPKHLPHIFDRYYRVDTHRSRAYGGAGLGLAIAKWIVEAHDGTIAATSASRGLTTFEIRLPKASVAES